MGTDYSTKMSMHLFSISVHHNNRDISFQPERLTLSLEELLSLRPIGDDRDYNMMTMSLRFQTESRPVTEQLFVF